MFNPFKSLGDINQMRQQAQQIQKELAAEKIEVNRDGVRIVITGDQKIESVEVNGVADENLKTVFEEAIRKSQEVAARKLQGMAGGLGGLLK